MAGSSVSYIEFLKAMFDKLVTNVGNPFKDIVIDLRNLENNHRDFVQSVLDEVAVARQLGAMVELVINMMEVVKRLSPSN